MGNRISKVYTRTGDDGSTGMASGERISKNSSLIHVVGDVDELNAGIGVLRSEDLPDFIDKVLETIQHDLFAIGGELAMPEYQVISIDKIKFIEQQLDALNEQLEPLKEFILPMGDRPVTLSHQARTVCRRAERSLIAYAENYPVRSELKQYLNRLSDYLFVVARTLSADKQLDEIFWENNIG